MQAPHFLLDIHAIRVAAETMSGEQSSQNAAGANTQSKANNTHPDQGSSKAGIAFIYILVASTLPHFHCIMCSLSCYAIFIPP